MTRGRGIIPATVALGTAAAALCAGGTLAFTPAAEPGTIALKSLSSPPHTPHHDQVSAVRFTASHGRRRPQHADSSRLQAKADDGEGTGSTGDAADGIGKRQSPADVELSDLNLSKMEFSKAVEVAKLKAEIDSIRNGPDAPFDAENELGKVVGGPSPPLDPDSVEAETDASVHAVESELFEAIDRGDFDRATDLKSKLGDMHFDDCASVLCVNSAFYRAFSEKDYDTMADIWLHDSSVCCIHPAHEPLVGAKDVLNSWKLMFDSSDTSFQHNRMEPSNVRLSVKGTTAIVTCNEEVFTRRFVRGRKRQNELVTKLTSTNIFRKVGGKWHIVHHHASWHADSKAAIDALFGGLGTMETLLKRRNRFSGRTDDGEKYMTAEDALGIPTNDGISGKGYFDKSSPNKGLEGISRNVPRLLGGAGAGPSPGGGPVKRVYMGSLSDLLNGGLDNIIQDSIGSEDSGNGEEGTVLQFHGNTDDIDDDEDNDDDNDDDHHGHDNSQPMIVRQISKEDDGARNGVPKDALRQSCITALRNLASKGEISKKQKRVLLTDIITCSAKGEFSMVEVAYELLCGEGDARSKDEAEEDFADQCRVFAAGLHVPEFPGGH